MTQQEKSGQHRLGRTVVGVCDDRTSAQIVARDLRAAGFDTADVSILMRPDDAMPEVGGGERKADQGTAVGASIGAVLGGIAGLAALSIPGIGPLLAAGPIAAALGALTGTALGGLVGSFTGLGIPEEQAKGYEAAVRAGDIVIVVRVADSAAEARA